ncbi:uncharacterized protein [Haliotis cracherodii]|uniref:uncharacterized protein n=1 Tax=Haliotis cracherodii TaxID=6455 RepID=UPI0039EA1676
MRRYIRYLVLCCVTCIIIYMHNMSSLLRNSAIRRVRNFQFLRDVDVNVSWSNACSYHLLHEVDRSASCMEPQWLCDEQAGISDVICRWFRSQNNTRENVTCLLPESNNLDVVNQHGGSLVPKIVYYVSLGIKEPTFLHYISFLSAKKFVEPWGIYVVSDVAMGGHWWNKAVKELGVRVIYRHPPRRLNNVTVKHRTHMSDIIRLQLLLANGGVYLDLDMVVLQSLDPLRVHDITLGLLDNGTGMGNAFIAAKRHSPFITRWYKDYKKYTISPYNANSMAKAKQLWLENPSTVNLESKRLYNPNWFERDAMFNKSNFNWRHNYAMHIWMDTPSVSFPKSPDDIKKLNNTFGQVLRYIYYGKETLLGI